MRRGDRQQEGGAGPVDFRTFAADRLAPLRRLGFLICGDWHLAEDAVSTVMTKLYVAWHDLGHVGDLDAYVRTMLVRAIVDERRRPWRRESPVSRPGRASSSPAGAPVSTPGRTAVGPGPASDAATEAVADRMVLHDALARMPTRRRAVLVLRYYQGMSVEETARAMGCSTGTVKSQTARALATLREMLPESADDPLLDGGLR